MEKKYIVCIEKEIRIENAIEMVSYFQQGWERGHTTLYTNTVAVVKEFPIETNSINEYINSINTLTDMIVKYAISEDKTENLQRNPKTGEYINIARIWTFDCYSIKDGTQNVIFYGEGDTYEEALANANIGEDYEVNESYQFSY